MWGTTLQECHPPEREWRSYIIDTVDNEKIAEFTKDQNIRSLSEFAPMVTQFHKRMQQKCVETKIDCVRQWWDQHSVKDKDHDGRVAAMVTAQTIANVALAVALASKAYFINISEETERNNKKQLVDKAKGHIEKTKLGKAPCCVGVVDVL